MTAIRANRFDFLCYPFAKKVFWLFYLEAFAEFPGGHQYNKYIPMIQSGAPLLP
tara:strand:+ start:844 stop:1005 length:162 start_codon:yes stop_codon:yes gene_type:complete